LDHGGNFQVGAGYYFNRFFGVTGNFMFNQLGITGSELVRLNVPDGNARVYTFTVDIGHLRHKSRICRSRCTSHTFRVTNSGARFVQSHDRWNTSRRPSICHRRSPNTFLGQASLI
jgi:hypothetical protein